MGFSISKIIDKVKAKAESKIRAKLEAKARSKISLPSNSVLKIDKNKRSERKVAADPVPEELAKTVNVFIGEWKRKAPVIAEPTEDPADFYRFGQASGILEKEVVNISAGIPIGISSKSLIYEILPKTLDDFEDVHASIRLVKGFGDNAKDLVPRFTKFLLESVQESEAERSQVVETFGEFFAFFYGKRPSTYTFTGTLLNTKNVNWLADWSFYYENFLRGTKAVEQNARIVLTYQGRQIEGFILNTSNTTQAATDKGVQMSFQVLVTKRSILSLSNDFGLTVVNGQLTRNKKLFNLDALKGFSRPEVSKAVNSAEKVMDKKENPSDTKKQTSNLIADVKEEYKLDDIIATITGGLKKKVSGLF